jgi:hypothetical protein
MLETLGWLVLIGGALYASTWMARVAWWQRAVRDVALWLVLR